MKGLCHFKPGFPLLGNVQWLNWWHGAFAHPCQNQWVTGQKRRVNPIPPPHHPTNYTGGPHTHEHSQNKSTAPNTQGPFDSAEREQTKLKSGQINMGKKTSVPPHSRGRGHIFCKQEICPSKQLKLSPEGFSWENRLQKEAVSRHYKVLKLVWAFTLHLAMLVNFGTHHSTIMFFYCLLNFVHSVELEHVHIPNTSKNPTLHRRKWHRVTKTNSATIPEVVKLSALKLPLTGCLGPWPLCN